MWTWWGFETVKAIEGNSVQISADESIQAELLRGQRLQAIAVPKTAKVKKMTPTFTGSLDKDFKGAEVLSYKKQDDAAVRSAIVWDEQNLYVAWDVADASPWVNGAAAPEMMYASGDTVDLQLATSAGADKNRADPAAGDLRLSIGNPDGSGPTAVLYRKVADEKHPKTFSSGVVKDYAMDSVVVLTDRSGPAPTIEIKPRTDGYVIEAAIPLVALGLKVTDGLTLRGDVGVTHSDPAGHDTALRTFWANQATGIVDDVVFELKMEPRNWGQLSFED